MIPHTLSLITIGDLIKLEVFIPNNLTFLWILTCCRAMAPLAAADLEDIIW